MAEPRVRRTETPLSTQEVDEYRALVRLAQSRLPETPDETAKELMRLCRLRTRHALLRTRLRFGRELLLVRVSDLDGDGRNEILVIDSDHFVHTPRFAPRQTENGPVALWTIGSHRYRGRLIGVSFSPFGVFHRQEAIVTSVEESDGSSVYRELKLTCDGQQWDVSELEHRSVNTTGFGDIRLIGDSSETGRIPVLRSRPDNGRLWVEILDDRVGPKNPAGTDFSKVSFLPGEVTDLVLAEDELIIAYARGGLQRVGRDGRLRSLLFPQWRFVCLAYSPQRQGSGLNGYAGKGLLLGGTSFGYVFAIDLSQVPATVPWRMDAGFLFSSMTLADLESSGRVDLVLGGIDGGLRIYELTEPQLLNRRCQQLFLALGNKAIDKLRELAPPRHEAHPAVQLYLLSRVLDSSGPATHAVVEMVRWFTLGQPGWHTLPERSQREAVVLLEHFLLLHLPQLSTIEGRSTPTGPLPLLSARQLQEGDPSDLFPHSIQDPTTKIQLARTVLAELVEIYLGAPRLVRHQIDRISRRLFEQYLQNMPTFPMDDDGAVQTDQPPPELRKLLNVRSLRAREYARTLAIESEYRLAHLQGLPDGERPQFHDNSDVVVRILRAIGLVEELRTDRFSIEMERLDLSLAALDPLDLDAQAHVDKSLWPNRCFIAGIGRQKTLRIQPLHPAHTLWDGSSPESEIMVWPWQPTQTGPNVKIPGHVRFVETRRLWNEGGQLRQVIVVGTEENGDTRLLLFLPLPDGQLRLQGETSCRGLGLESIGFDCHLEDIAETTTTGKLVEHLVLRMPGTSERIRPQVLVLDTENGVPRLRNSLLPSDLLAVVSMEAGSLYLSSSRIMLNRVGEKSVWAPSPANACCAALDAAATTLAVGTHFGQVQVLTATDDSLKLHAQYLLPKGISALCFIPEEVFGPPCLAIGTEDEQVHILAINYEHDGQEVTRLAAGGSPQRMLCRKMPEGGFRLLIVLSGGVLTSWEAHPDDDYAKNIDHLMELGSRAAAGRVNLLRAALRGLGPHIRAVAMRELLRSARDGKIAGSVFTVSDNKPTTNPAAKPSQPSKLQPERGTAKVASVLHLCRLMLQVDGQEESEPAPKLPVRSDAFDVAAWPLPRPPRHRLLVSQSFDALVPIALGGSGSGADAQQSRLARELIGKLIQFCEDPIAVRSDLLQCVEAHVRAEHIEELSLWLPPLILYYDGRLDARPVPWPLTVDGVAALFLRHLQRLDRAQLFDQAEPTFFRNIVAVLEAVGPTLPSRFLLTNLALLLRSALAWQKVFLAGDLARVRLYLPHQVIEAMCQPEILPDEDIRKFLLGMSRRWGPRLPTVASDENDDVMASIASEENLAWLFEVAVENGFDQLYYEKLSDDLARLSLPLTADGVTTDAWILTEMVQSIEKLFGITNITELSASLQPIAVEKALGALRLQHRLSNEHLSYQYRDEAWALLDEELFLNEQQFLQQALQDMDRKNNKAQIAHSLEGLAEQLEQRRNALRLQILAQLSSEPTPHHTGAFVSKMLRVRPQATVVALLTVWWGVLIEEANRLRTEPDFEVRFVSDLGIAENRRMLRYAVLLASDAPRSAHSVQLLVRSVEPKEVRARVLDPDAMDLEPGQEMGLVIECPAAVAADGLRYRIVLELSHDGDKRTERAIEGQFRRESRTMARALFDSMGERLPTLFALRKQQLNEMLKPASASVVLTTAFPAHAHELLAEVVGLEWPERPVETLEDWRMVNVSVRGSTPSSAPPPPSQRQASPSLRDVIQQIGQRLGTLLGLPSADRLDTVEAVVRAVADAPVSGGGTASRGLILLGLPELAEKAHLEDSDLRQLFLLGARIALAYRGKVLLVVSPPACATLLQTLPSTAMPPPSLSETQSNRALSILDLDAVADPLSQQRSDERIRTELEQALLSLMINRDGIPLSSQSLPTLPGLATPSTAQSAVRMLLDETGGDLRLCAECLPLVEQALRERSRAALAPSAFEARVGTFLSTLWGALPLSHRLYLAALCADSVDLDVTDLRAGMVVDQPVYSISGKDRLPTSKVVASAGIRIDQRTIDDLTRVMWLKKVRIRGSLHDTRGVLWTFLKQTKPRLRGRSPVEDWLQRDQANARWLEPVAHDLRTIGLLSQLKMGGDRVFFAFTSPAAREWLRTLLGVVETEQGLPNTIDGRNLTRGLPLWDAASVDRTLGGNSQQLRAVLGWNRPNLQGGQSRWQEFLDLSRACRKWMDGQDEHRFIDAIARYFRLDLVDGTGRDGTTESGPIHLRSVQVRFREKRQLPWLKRVVLYLPSGQPDRATLEKVQFDLRRRLPMLSGGSGPSHQVRTDASFAGIDATISDTSLSAIVVVPELSPEVLAWSRNLFHVAAIDITDIQHAALHENPVEELIRRLAAAASYAALSPFRSKMGLANQELIEEMFYGRRALLEEIRGQRQENFLVVGPRKIGKTSLLQRVRFELEQQGYRVIPRGMDYTTAPTSRELLKSMILELLEDIDPAKAQAGFALGEPLPPLRAVVDQWARKNPDHSLAIVLDEIDTILRIERRAYLLGEWREAAAIGQALASLQPHANATTVLRLRTGKLRETLEQLDFPRDVIDGIVEGVLTPPEQRRQSPLLEELRSASALLLSGGSVCRVILAGHAELVEARWDLFGPLLNFAKLRMLGPLDETSAERMVREPFARLGLRFESQTVEQLLSEKTFRVPAWLQHCGALIIQSIDERLRSSRREEQKITDRDVLLALEKVYAEERASLQSENGMYMLGPECSFVLLSLVEEPWFTVDTAVDYLHLWFQTLDSRDRQRISRREEDFAQAFNHEAVRRIVRDLTNTFYLVSDEAEYLSTEGVAPGHSSPGFPVPSVLLPQAGANARMQTSSATSPTPRIGDLGRDRLRHTFKVSRSMVSAIFHDEMHLQRRIELARRAMGLWKDGRGVWARTVHRSGY